MRFLIIRAIFSIISFSHYLPSHSQMHGSESFVTVKETRFQIDGRNIYLNGFNSYWMMYMASDHSSRYKVTSAFEQASATGMNVARTWAFSDGGNDRSLQTSPGAYNEETFQGLDFVISEAKKHGVYVILSMVNNYDVYGGRAQYVQWAVEKGEKLSTDDDFYTNPVVRTFYKDHVQALLTRVNTLTGLVYKDDPTIFAWELINEPRSNDSSGRIIQDWVNEIAGHVKSIDANHLVEIGLEGFYGGSRSRSNPLNQTVGTDFIGNNRLGQVDFATIHLYPESWFPSASEDDRREFAGEWVRNHVANCDDVLKKPLVLAEFGKSSKEDGFSVDGRNRYFGMIYEEIVASVEGGRALVGGLFWQLMVPGMERWSDGYDVILEESSSTAAVIAQQSQKLSSILNL